MNASLLFALALGAADQAPSWDVNDPPGPKKTVRFVVEEGTWMNLDVSPDGRTIVFDLLGDLYLLPIAGGEARPLLAEHAHAMHPRFSPDGRFIAFTSDRGGGDNLWIIPAAGGEPRQVTKESFRLLANPVWTPDGEYLIARKHFTSERSLGAGEMWIYHRSGGAGLPLTSRKNDQQDVNEPALSPDGRYLYFSEDMSGGNTFEYNKSPHGIIYVIRRLDRESGEIEDLIRIPGGAVRPQPSPDGRFLAFVRRVREKTVLSLYELASGEIRVLWDGLSQDQQEAWAIHGVYPSYQWTPDGRAIVIWAKGGLWRVSVPEGRAERIPFRVEVEKTLVEPVHHRFRVDRERFRARMLRDLALSPDGRIAVFHAVGRLWKMRLPDGRPERLTRREGEFEYQPAFAPDGKSVLYVSFSDEETSAIRRVSLDGRRNEPLTREKGFFAHPRPSPDGRLIAYQRGRPHGLLDYRFGRDAGIWVMQADGGAPRRISRSGSAPQWHPRGDRVFFQTGQGLQRKLESVDLNGAERREHLSLKYPTEVALSPDGRYLAFVDHFEVYVAAFPETGRSVELGRDSKAIPVARVSGESGTSPVWSADGRRLHWLLGPRLYTRALEDSFAFLAGRSEPLPPPEATPFREIELTLPVDRPGGRLALVNGRILTMRGEEVIEQGEILIEGDAIAAVGAGIAIPGDARVLDLEGRTVVPGFIDVHAHASHFHSGISPQRNWSYEANLAFGITTMHDPSANTETVFSQAELVQAGASLGPRVYSTGTILYGADGTFRAVVDSLQDARAHVRRLAAVGAISVKSYNQPRRDQRQMINQAARELGLNVVMEGGSTFMHNLTMLLDGPTGIEHNLPIAPLYQDVLTLWSHTPVVNTPTLVVSYGGLMGELYFYDRDEVWKDERLLRFYPRETIDARAIRRQRAPDWDYHHRTVAQAKKALAGRGVKIAVGGHGQLQGLAAHWEMWMLHEGGFAPLEVLRAATLHGAEYLGLEQDLGSIEPGKLADLAVLDGDPRRDIRATARVRWVIKNGRLYDAESMAERLTGERPAARFYWQRHGAASLLGPAGVHGGPAGVCHCPAGLRALRLQR